MGYSSTPRWVLIALLVIAGKSLKEASYSELGIPTSFVCLPFYEAELVFFLVWSTKLYNLHVKHPGFFLALNGLYFKEEEYFIFLYKCLFPAFDKYPHYRGNFA